MKQHAIDLMPASIRERNRAGLRSSRCVLVCVIMIISTVVVATHSRLGQVNAEQAVQRARDQAAAVFAIEAETAKFEKSLAQANAFMSIYERAAHPLNIGDVLATIINVLPESITLEHIDMDAGIRATTRAPRAKLESKSEQPQRWLRLELSGFAATDEHIAQLVSILDGTAPFRNVTLDFSRTKKVNDRDAREFRLSLRIDLNAAYLPYRASLNDVREIRHVSGEGSDAP